MVPNFLLPEQTVRQNGTGPVVPLGDTHPDAVSITLGITRIIEQESLELAIWGSADGETWGPKPLAVFPQKFYCGVYSLVLDLSDQPDIHFLRTEWKVNRWGRGESLPLFNVYVFAEPASARVMATTH